MGPNIRNGRPNKQNNFYESYLMNHRLALDYKWFSSSKYYSNKQNSYIVYQNQPNVHSIKTNQLNKTLLSIISTFTYSSSHLYVYIRVSFHFWWFSLCEVSEKYHLPSYNCKFDLVKNSNHISAKIYTF